MRLCRFTSLRWKPSALFNRLCVNVCVRFDMLELSCLPFICQSVFLDLSVCLSVCVYFTAVVDMSSSMYIVYVCVYVCRRVILFLTVCRFIDCLSTCFFIRCVYLCLSVGVCCQPFLYVYLSVCFMFVFPLVV